MEVEQISNANFEAFPGTGGKTEVKKPGSGNRANPASTTKANIRHINAQRAARSPGP